MSLVSPTSFFKSFGAYLSITLSFGASTTLIVYKAPIDLLTTCWTKDVPLVELATLTSSSGILVYQLWIVDSTLVELDYWARIVGSLVCIWIS